MLTRFMHSDFFRFVQLLLARMKKNDVTGNAAQLAYYMLFSIFPMLLVAVALLGFLNLDKDSIFQMVEDFAPKQIINFIQTNLDQVLSNRSGGLLSVGILATLWSASNGMAAVMKALNKAYGIIDRRNFIIQKLLSVLFTIAMLVTVAITLLLLVFGQQIGDFLLHYLHMPSQIIDVWNGIRELLSVLVILVVFTFLYWFAPNRKGTIKTVLPGALFASVGWSLASIGFAFYVNNFGNYTATYGSIGIVIILMLWFFLTGIILIVGGELNGTLAFIKQKKEVGDLN